MKDDTLVDIKLSFVLRLHAFVNFCGKNKRQIVIITHLSLYFCLLPSCNKGCSMTLFLLCELIFELLKLI